jgi:hypothetical protein
LCVWSFHPSLVGYLGVALILAALQRRRAG